MTMRSSVIAALTLNVVVEMPSLVFCVPFVAVSCDFDTAGPPWSLCCSGLSLLPSLLLAALLFDDVAVSILLASSLLSACIASGGCLLGSGRDEQDGAWN